MKGLELAESEKALGNQAIARQDRAAAITHYTGAIDCLCDARGQNPNDSEMKSIEELFSICLGNRAAAWLLAGPGQDPKKALRDSMEAVRLNEDYIKA